MSTKTESAMLTLTDHVPLTGQDSYEALITELHHLFQQQTGFISVDVVRHARSHQMEYTVLLRSERADDIKAWRKEPRIDELLKQIYSLTGGPAQQVEAIGLEFWIDHAAGKEMSFPPYWKRVALSVVAVYPMLMLLMAISHPLIGHLPQSVQVLVIVVVLSALLTWPILPFLSKRLQPWLLSGHTRS